MSTNIDNNEKKSINLEKDPRLIRRLGRSVTSDFGLGKRNKGNKRNKRKGTRKLFYSKLNKSRRKLNKSRII